MRCTALTVAAFALVSPAIATALPQVPSSGIGSNDQSPLALSSGITMSKKRKLLLEPDLVALHKNLTSISSVSFHEGKISAYLADILRSQGYTVELQHLTSERANVLAWPGGKLSPQVLLTSHIDTVPPFLPYNTTTLSNGTTLISGRGSVDAKASVAAMIIALNSLLDSVEVHPNSAALLFVVGEEVQGDGMRLANDLDLRPSSIIFGEPTEGKLASGHKGIVVFDVTATGIAAHSGYPWLGRSANAVLVSVLAALMKLEHDLPTSERFGRTTVNVGEMHGGVAANVVAAEAGAKVSIRIAEGTPEEIEKRVRDVAQEAVKGFVKEGEKVEDVLQLKFWGRGYGPVPLDYDVPGFDSQVVNYGTDVPNLDRNVKDQKRYLYGPGSIQVAHGPKEALTQAELEAAVEDYKKLILHATQT